MNINLKKIKFDTTTIKDPKILQCNPKCKSVYGNILSVLIEKKKYELFDTICSDLNFKINQHMELLIDFLERMFFLSTTQQKIYKNKSKMLMKIIIKSFNKIKYLDLGDSRCIISIHKIMCKIIYFQKKNSLRMWIYLFLKFNAPYIHICDKYHSGKSIFALFSKDKTTFKQLITLLNTKDPNILQIVHSKSFPLNGVIHLINRGLSPNIMWGHHKMPIIFHACKSNDVRLCRMLLNHPEFIEPDGKCCSKSLISYAIHRKVHVDMLIDLIQHKCIVVFDDVVNAITKLYDLNVIKLMLNSEAYIIPTHFKSRYVIPHRIEGGIMYMNLKYANILFEHIGTNSYMFEHNLLNNIVSRNNINMLKIYIHYFSIKLYHISNMHDILNVDGLDCILQNADLDIFFKNIDYNDLTCLNFELFDKCVTCLNNYNNTQIHKLDINKHHIMYCCKEYPNLLTCLMTRFELSPNIMVTDVVNNHVRRWMLIDSIIHKSLFKSFEIVMQFNPKISDSTIYHSVGRISNDNLQLLMTNYSGDINKLYYHKISNNRCILETILHKILRSCKNSYSHNNNKLLDTVTILLKRGSNPTIVNSEGATSLNVIMTKNQYNNRRVDKVQFYIKIILLLLKFSGSVENSKLYFENNASHIFSQCEYPQLTFIVKQFIKKRFDPFTLVHDNLWHFKQKFLRVDSVRMDILSMLEFCKICVRKYNSNSDISKYFFNSGCYDSNLLGVILKMMPPKSIVHTEFRRLEFCLQLPFVYKYFVRSSIYDINVLRIIFKMMY